MVGTNNTDNIALTVANGIVQLSTTTHATMNVGTLSTVTLTNGGQVLAHDLVANGALLVTGPGSYLTGDQAMTGRGSLVIRDGASALAYGAQNTVSITIDGGSFTNKGGYYIAQGLGSVIRIVNGGVMYGATTGYPDVLTIGANGPGTQYSRIIVGSDTGTSMLSEFNIVAEGPYGPQVDTDVIVSTNGVVQIRGKLGAAGGGSPTPMYAAATSNLRGCDRDEHQHHDWHPRQQRHDLGCRLWHGHPARLRHDQQLQRRRQLQGAQPRRDPAR